VSLALCPSSDCFRLAAGASYLQAFASPAPPSSLATGPDAVLSRRDAGGGQPAARRRRAAGPHRARGALQLWHQQVRGRQRPRGPRAQASGRACVPRPVKGSRRFTIGPSAASGAVQILHRALRPAWKIYHAPAGTPVVPWISRPPPRMGPCPLQAHLQRAARALPAAALRPHRLPPDVGGLSCLEFLDISKNMLWQIPQEVRARAPGAPSLGFVRSWRQILRRCLHGKLRGSHVDLQKEDVRQAGPGRQSRPGLCRAW
jgi:hypothetical protein